MKFILALLLSEVKTEDCVDKDGIDAGGDGCDWYYLNDSSCGYWDTSDFMASD